MATLPTPQVRSQYYHPELDALRFLAAFGVFLFHSVPNKNVGVWMARGLPAPVAFMVHGLIGSGAYGVDLFFALSAFLITQLLLREREQTGRLDVKAFYLRRVLRIWPLYFFFIALAYALTFFRASEVLPGKYIAGFLLLFGNWVFVFAGIPHSVAGPLWSISLEEQFYLSWPQLVNRSSLLGMKIAAWSFVAVAFATSIVLVRHTQAWEAFWYNTLVHLDPIAFGILLAIRVHQTALKPDTGQRVTLLLIGMAAWIVVACYASPTAQITTWQTAVFGYPVVALGAVAMLFAVYDGGFTILANRALVYLGKISYGLYVYHVLGLGIARWVFPGWRDRSRTFAAYWILALAVTLIFAAVSYRFLETPFLRLKDRYARVKSRPV